MNAMVCPEWCTLATPDRLHLHDHGLLVDDGRLQLYVDHEGPFFKISDTDGIDVTVTIYDDGHHDATVTIDRNDIDPLSVDELRALAASAEAAAAFVEGLEATR